MERFDAPLGAWSHASSSIYLAQSHDTYSLQRFPESDKKQLGVVFMIFEMANSFLAHAGRSGLKAVDGAIIYILDHAGINRSHYLERFFIVMNGSYQPNSFMMLYPSFRQPS